MCRHAIPVCRHKQDPLQHCPIIEPLPTGVTEAPLLLRQERIELGPQPVSHNPRRDRAFPFLRTDSAYVEKCFKQNWHERWFRDGSWKGSNGPVKNRDLWERLFGLVWDGSRDVTFVWIRGHAGDPNIHRVDQLARAAALAAG